MQTYVYIYINNIFIHLFTYLEVYNLPFLLAMCLGDVFVNTHTHTHIYQIDCKSWIVFTEWTHYNLYSLFHNYFVFHVSIFFLSGSRFTWLCGGCCTAVEREHSQAARALHNTFAFCNWIKQHHITTNNLRPSWYDVDLLGLRGT